MGKVNYTVEQIIIKLRDIEVLCSQGNTIAEAARQASITEQTYYRWRKACNFGRVGYRQVTDLIRNGGRKINHKRVERI